jgi:hypothetical protein
VSTTTCPTDVKANTSTPCGSQTDDDCSNPNRCDGAGACDPMNELGTHVCRAAGTDATCDPAETCGVSTTTCPTDVKANTSTLCGSQTDDDCSNPDRCDGAGACDPKNELSTHVCRVAGTDATCDPAETCGVSTTTCPADAKANTSTPCGSQTDDDCSNPNRCDGAGACDPMNELGTHVCRAAGTDATCDPAETCGGSTTTCPADVKANTSTLCGSQTDDDCSNPDRCDGAGACDPKNELSTHVCRVAGTDATCDPAETCGGSTTTCPADAKANTSTPCGSQTDDDCSNPNRCDGGGACDPMNELGTHVCRAAGTDATCDPAETCGGSTTTCPADTKANTSTPCGSQADDDCSNPNR